MWHSKFPVRVRVSSPKSLGSLTVKTLISYIKDESSILSSGCINILPIYNIIYPMIIISILSLLLSNAVNVRRDISILYNRIAILILIYCILNDISSLTVVTKGIGLHGGLLLITNITQIFHIFLFIVSILILTLTSFYPRKV